jgi:putative oxidoreductase
MSTASPRSSPDPLNRASMQTPLIDRVAPGWGDAILLLGRILIGGIFVQSGFDKLIGLGTFAAGLAARGLPAALVPVLASIGASVEFFGGLAIVFGLMTRYAALLMIAFVIVATLISHRFWVFGGAERRTQTVQFAKNVAIIGGFLFLFVTGGGRYRLDRWWRSSE